MDFYQPVQAVFTLERYPLACVINRIVLRRLAHSAAGKLEICVLRFTDCIRLLNCTAVN